MIPKISYIIHTFTLNSFQTPSQLAGIRNLERKEKVMWNLVPIGGIYFCVMSAREGLALVCLPQITNSLTEIRDL
jgi:hypothetical protein